MNSNDKPTRAGAPPKTTPPAPPPSGSSTERRHFINSPATEPAKTEADKVREVAELFQPRRQRVSEPRTAATGSDDAGEPDEPSGLLGPSQRVSVDPFDEEAHGADGSDPVAEGRPAGPLDVKSIAQALGITQKQVYEGLKFDVGGDEPLSLSQLKDAAKDQTTALRETAQREADLGAREAAIIRDQQLLARVTSDLRGKLSPETVHELQRKTVETEHRERTMMARTMPEVVSSPAALHEFSNSVATMLSAYGYQPHELNFTDHRMLLVLRDMLRLKHVLRDVAAIETRPGQPPKAPGRGAKPPRPDRDALAQRARHGTEADKVAAVSSLISGHRPNGKAG